VQRLGQVRWLDGLSFCRKGLYFVLFFVALYY